MRVFLLSLALFACAEGRDLRIYAIDVEGGKSTLYVSPSGESLLIDAGYEGSRDPERILAAIHDAKLTHIDHFLLTHYHKDHAGGVRQLAAKVRIDRFYDHGAPVESGVSSEAEAWTAAHRGKPHIVLRPGDRIPVKGLDVQVVASAGKLIAEGSCAGERPKAEDGENSNSVALIIGYGRFRVADLGDLSPDREYDLACPGNKLSRVDLYMTTHHGTGASVPPQILAALTPKVAIMNNSFSKGGSAKALEALQNARPPIELWQLHASKAGGEKLNTPEKRIANTMEECQGLDIRVSASSSGEFTVVNGRTKSDVTYRRGK